MAQEHVGRDGSLVVDGDSIVITHRDEGAGDRRFELRRVTDVHFESATRWTSGILTVAVDGEPLVVPTGTAPGSDPFTVVFKRKANDEFAQLHRWLVDIVDANRGDQ